jgi:UDP-N-acetylmuramoyl-tripeptide--D-alanyl-D-alanine ligase
LKLEAVLQSLNAADAAIDPALRDREVGSFVIDSRAAGPESLFFALSQPEYKDNGFNGDFADSTAYVADAFAAGALACVVRPDRFDEHRGSLEQYTNRLLVVPDVIKALQAVARSVYQQWGGPVVGITGSAGKTTAKEITAHVLEASGRRVLRNIKNYNNGLGHPLTVLDLATAGDYDIAVLEMGMSTPMHEIRRLCEITPPDVAVELNVLPVHLEHLGSIEAIRAAKAELIEGMKPGGLAVLNADDERVASMRPLANGDVVTYGIEHSADVMASGIRFARFGETQFELVTPEGQTTVRFQLSGRHNIMNALAATAAALRFGMSTDEIGAALSAVKPPVQRGEILRFRDGFTVVNDSYNSNPDALLSMVQTLVDGSNGALRRIVVAGEMLELGDLAEQAHFDTGRAIARSGVDMLIGVRGLAEELVRGAQTEGLDAKYVTDSDEAARLVADTIRDGDVLLVKGSRGVRTEKVVEELTNKFQLEGELTA